MIVGKLPNCYSRNTIIVFVFIITIGLIASIPTGHTSGDFDIYISASKNYLAKASIYTPHQGIEEFKYLPFFALLFSPLAMCNKVFSLYLWGILNIALLYCMFYLLYKLKQISFNRFRDFFIIFCLFALTGRYIFSNIKVGQVNILLSSLLVLTIYFEIKKKPFLASIPLALSLTIKLFPLLFLVYFVLRRRFKIVFFTFFLTLIFLLLPSVYSGFSLNLKYLQEWFDLIKSTPANMLYSVKNYSLLSFFSWFFVVRHEPYFILDYRYITKGLPPEVYYAWLASCFLLFGSFFYDSLSKKNTENKVAYLDYSSLFVCMLLFNPLTYLNALVFLIIPCFFVLRALFYSVLSKRQIVLIGCFVVVSFIFSMAYNKIFFADIEQFYQSLKFRFPMWAILSIYLSLWLVKATFKAKKTSVKSELLNE